MPNASPAVIAAKIMQISFAVPAAERNLTSENAPATATPAPILPLTSIITTATVMGNRAVVIKKLLLDCERK